MAQFMLMGHHPTPSDDLSEDALTLLEKFGMTLPSVKHFFDDEEILKHSQEQTIFMLLRAALVWAHEQSKEISRQTTQGKQLFETAPFGLVSWILRDSWGHDLRLKFNQVQRSKLPIRWGNVQLTAELDGKIPSTRAIPLLDVYSLIEAHEQLCLEMCKS
jgi:hypothetical protein